MSLRCLSHQALKWKKNVILHAYAQKPSPWADLHQIWFWGSCCWRNHLWQFFGSRSNLWGSKVSGSKPVTVNTLLPVPNSEWQIEKINSKLQQQLCSIKTNSLVLIMFKLLVQYAENDKTSILYRVANLSIYLGCPVFWFLSWLGILRMKNVLYFHSPYISDRPRGRPKKSWREIVEKDKMVSCLGFSSRCTIRVYQEMQMTTPTLQIVHITHYMYKLSKPQTVRRLT